MNDERCDRDRVTAILTLAEAARAQGTWADVDWDPEWAYRRLLEALDTIDQLRASLYVANELHESWRAEAKRLNGGNE